MKLKVARCQHVVLMINSIPMAGAGSQVIIALLYALPNTSRALRIPHL
jgi:hypothetical protein